MTDALWGDSLTEPLASTPMPSGIVMDDDSRTDSHGEASTLREVHARLLPAIGPPGHRAIPHVAIARDSLPYFCDTTDRLIDRGGDEGRMTGVSARPQTVREAVHGLMRVFGMTTVFGNPGSTELPFFRDWPDDFAYILGLQEAASVAMADGFAQVTRRPALVNLHSAAGVGNAMGSIHTAWRNATPLVILAGQQSRSLLALDPYLHALQATEMPRPYVKWSCEPARPSDVPAAFARAVYTAMQPPRGPVFVSVPADDWDVPAEPVDVRPYTTSVAPDPSALRRLADAVSVSQRPAFIVGPAVDRDGAWDVMVALAERSRASVWVSPFSARCSFPEDHPLFTGFLVADRRAVTRVLAEAGHDLIVVFGAPVFTYHVPSDGLVIPSGSSLVQITDDPAAAAMAPVGESILATLDLAIPQLLDLVGDSSRPMPTPMRRPAPPPPSDPPSPAFVLHALSEAMPEDAILVEEAPSHRPAMHDELPIRRSGAFYAGAGGGLGWGLPAAVGVALADRTRPVVCLVGDGSSMYSIQALWTAAQHRLSLTVVVLNNGGYGALRSFSTLLDVANPPGVDLPNLDIVSIARGFGCTAGRIDSADGLIDRLRTAIASEHPTVLDVTVEAAVPALY